MYNTRARDDVLQVRTPQTEWLTTGWGSGLVNSDAAYAISVPTGWDRTDLDTYVEERRNAAGFEQSGPALLTGVAMEHARGAQLESVTVIATAGLSNPAMLPMDPSGAAEGQVETSTDTVGTVNLLIWTEARLDLAPLANLLSVAVEAKTATLLSAAGVPGTTTDAVLVGTKEGAEPIRFTGNGTPIGQATRACVRDAVQASLASRYADSEVPGGIDDAEYGVVTNMKGERFEIPQQIAPTNNE